jgi:hypothetical protein
MRTPLVVEVVVAGVIPRTGISPLLPGDPIRVLVVAVAEVAAPARSLT